jgi:hypothetical protein
VRVVTQDVAVLERARLAFVGIAHQILGAGILARHETPFQAGRKSRAAAASQRRLFHLGNNLLGRDLLR